MSDTTVTITSETFEYMADRIEELEADLRQTKISEIFWRDGWHALDQDKRAVEAKLAKAVRALKFIGCDDSPEGKHARTTLAELTSSEAANGEAKGGKDE